MTTQTLESRPHVPEFADLTARDLMGAVDGTIGQDATLHEVVKRFGDGARHLVVLDSDGRCAGVIGARHITQARLFDPRGDEEIPVRELGIASWIALWPEDSLRTCAQMLVEHDLDAIPVIDRDQHILGLVTAHAIARAAADVPPPWHPVYRTGSVWHPERG